MFIRQLKNVYHRMSAFLAAWFYGFPGKKLIVIGITGTDGKTTTTHLIHHILKTAGKKASLVSSVHAEIAGKQYDTGFHVTTPDSWMLQKFLASAVENKEDYMVLEVTSHGLDQNRVGGIDFSIGVLTNVTHEHLDYHKTYEHYLSTKEKLLKKAKIAIVNRDDESFKRLTINAQNKKSLVKEVRDPVTRTISLDFSLMSSEKKIITYGIKSNADLTPQKFSFTSPLPGKYNEYNCLAAIAVAQQLGIGDAVIRKALQNFTGIIGRFETISTQFGFDVIIDFAHTPNALLKVLETVRIQTKGKLIHVFGSAAKRDSTKRPLMGEASAQFADIIVLTEEDYRNESVETIMQHIAAGAKKIGVIELASTEYDPRKNYTKPLLIRIANRADAINFAVSIARKGDVVITTGKAHESSLARGSVEHPWSEHTAVKQALHRRRA